MRRTTQTALVMAGCTLGFWIGAHLPDTPPWMPQQEVVGWTSPHDRDRAQVPASRDLVRQSPPARLSQQAIEQSSEPVWTRPTSGVRALGQDLAAAAGWVGREWTCLDQLWTRESGWNPLARNRSSGAFGIAQALPASKMPAAAQAGDPASQIGWGLTYIAARYGTPCAAWTHSQRTGWY